MIRLSEQLLQALDELHGHDLLPAVIVSFDHHWLQSESLSLAIDAPSPVRLDGVLPLVFEGVVHEVGWAPSS